MALYGGDGGRWTMTERGRAGTQRSPGALIVGRNAMRWTGSSLEIDVDDIAVPIPARVRGTVRLTPTAIQPDVIALDAAGKHVWRPIAPHARVEVAFDAPNRSWSGSGYFDANAGSEPLEAGFRTWTWARAHRPGGGATVLYDVNRRRGARATWALDISDAGLMTPRPAPPIARLPRGGWGVAGDALSDGPARLVRRFEDSPFYTRAQIEIGLDGARVDAVHESLDLDRFAASWVKVLLPFRMPRLA